MLSWLLLARAASAIEWCNGVDDDGDGRIDEGPVAVGVDRDRDGFASDAWLAPACDAASGPGGDCDDEDPDVGPTARETCDGRDEDCDGVVDPGVCPCPVVATDTRSWQVCTATETWTDADRSCGREPWHLASLGSTTSQREAEQVIAPYAAGAGVPFWIGFNDRSAEGEFRWSDGSSPTYANWRAGEPNNGGGAYTNEDCVEIEWTGLWDDQPCGDLQPYLCEAGCAPHAWYQDTDGDGLGAPGWGGAATCAAPDPTGWVTNALDCDDGDAAQPTAGFPDLDGDGAGTGDALVACGVPLAEVAGDCDDGDPGRSPLLAEVACDAVDDDCDPTTPDRPDADADGVDACDDCDDADPRVFPGAADDPHDGVDSDCDGTVEVRDRDADGLPDDEEASGDTDGDGVPDVDDPDSDDDGALDGAEGVPAAWDPGGGDAGRPVDAAYGFGLGCATAPATGWAALALAALTLPSRRRLRPGPPPPPRTRGPGAA